ncbi:hypothetical protein ACJX0J_035525, partial [Zea mays]
GGAATSDERSSSQKVADGKGAEPPAAGVSNRLKPSDDAEKLVAFMEDHYDDVVARVQSFDEFYHAIFELI